MAFVELPNTIFKNSHSMAIKCNGQIVGAISKWSINYSRTATPVYEFGYATVGSNDIMPSAGEATEIVPGNITGMDISIGRTDIFKIPFEKAFGSLDFEMLSQQANNIQFTQFTKSPTGEFDENLIIYGVWFTSLGRQYEVTGDRVVRAEAKAMFTRIRKAT